MDLVLTCPGLPRPLAGAVVGAVETLVPLEGLAYAEVDMEMAARVVLPHLGLIAVVAAAALHLTLAAAAALLALMAL